MSCEADVDWSATITVTVEAFERRGAMFDGRPIFVAQGYDVKEAYQQGYVGRGDVEQFDELNRLNVRRLVEKEYPGAIELDERYGHAPLSDSERYGDGRLDSKRLAKRHARLLVAVRV
jgi:hypothetical protein